METSVRWPKHAVWIGLAVTLAGALSYFLYFFQFPDLRDFPIVNLPIVVVGLMMAAVGCWKVFRQRGRALGKMLAAAGFLLSLGIANLFGFYVFVYSYQLPASADAPASQSEAPDFALLDQAGQIVRLSDYRGSKLVLVFYRGNW